MTASQDDDATRKMQFLFQLRQKGVTDTRVLQAMEKIDRGAFVKGHFSFLAPLGEHFAIRRALPHDVFPRVGHPEEVVQKTHLVDTEGLQGPSVEIAKL